MAKIEVHLTEAEVSRAAEEWAVTRVLNEGRVVSSSMGFTVDKAAGRTTLNGMVVVVETDRMKDCTRKPFERVLGPHEVDA